MIKCSNCGEISKDPTTERCPHCDGATATLVDMKVDQQDEPQSTQVDLPAPPALAEGHRFCLTLTHDGSPDEQARRISFREGEQIIGRSETVDVYIALPSLSRQHAAIWLKGGTPHIRDLGSLAGTLVNDIRITEPTALSEGDRISLGESVHLATTIEQGTVPRKEDRTIEKTIGSVLHDLAQDQQRDGTNSPHLETIANLCTKMADITDEGELLCAVLQHLSTVIPATRFLALIGSNVEELTVVAEERKEGAPEPVSPPSKGILRRVMYSLSGKPFVTCDAQGEDHLKQRRSIMVSDIHTVICAALTDGTTCIGMLYADGRLVEREITTDDENFLYIVAQLTYDKIMARRNAATQTQLRAQSDD